MTPEDYIARLRRSYSRATFVVIAFACLAFALFTAPVFLPWLEATLFPVLVDQSIDPKSVKMTGPEICWTRKARKVRDALTVAATWNITGSDVRGETRIFLGVRPRREEDLPLTDPNVQELRSSPPGDVSIRRCVDVPPAIQGRRFLIEGWVTYKSPWGPWHLPEQKIDHVEFRLP